jgi:hypothetical protein
MTQYISNGASVSIPSENLGFYFSGMRAPDWGVINTDDGSANTTANTLLKVDLTAMQEMRWSNYSLPSFIDARADAEMVWLPISEQGALVVLGGTAYPASVFPAGLSTSQKDENVRRLRHGMGIYTDWGAEPNQSRIHGEGLNI